MPLRIPRAVSRCVCSGRRVRLIHKDRCLTPEDIVLRRWRERSREPLAVRSGTVFAGCRLPPGTWRIVQACLNHGFDVAGRIDIAGLAALVARIRQREPTWRAPHASKLAALITYLRMKHVLIPVLQRRRDAAAPGIPDLFLYRRHDEHPVFGGRFVEVKRAIPHLNWKEAVSSAQRQELAFLRERGLKAQVLYLQEQRPGDHAGRSCTRALLAAPQGVV